MCVCVCVCVCVCCVRVRVRVRLRVRVPVRVSAYDSDDVFRVVCAPPYDEVGLFLLQNYGDISTYAVTITFWICHTLRTGCDIDGSVGRSAV